MWPFSTKPPDPQQPDPIGDICRLLAEKPWEWEAGETDEEDEDERTPALTHLSGVEVSWRTDSWTRRTIVWFGFGGGPYTQLTDRDSARLFAGIQANAAARVRRPKCDYDSVAHAMADAVKAGDRVAARQLADLVMELESGVA